MFSERRARLEENMEKLRKEHADTSPYLKQLVIPNVQVEEIKTFCETIKRELEKATFEQKRQSVGMLNVRGTLAIKDNERIIYVKCLVTPQQRLSLVPTSHLLSIGATVTMHCDCPPMAPSQ